MTLEAVPEPQPTSTKVTEQIRNFRKKEIESYPKSLAEYPAWLIARYGVTGMIAALVIPLWVSKEKQTDAFLEFSNKSVETLQALKGQIEDQAKMSEISKANMKEATSTIIQELKLIREQQLRQPNSTTQTH